MTVSLRWLLDRPELALSIAAGTEGLDSRPLLFVHSIDLADPSPWLSGGELMLTTGQHLSAERDQQREYIRQVDDAGVAAVGFGVGLTHQSIPDGVLDAGDELGLPILRVPLPTPFAAITKAVVDQLSADRFRELRRAAQAQPRMTRAAASHGVPALVRELSRATSAPVVFLDRSLTVAGAARSTSALVEEVKAVVRKAGTKPASMAVMREDGTLTVQRVRVGDTSHGYVCVATDSQLGEVGKVLLGHAASLLALELEKPRRLRTTRNRLGSTVLELLLRFPEHAIALGEQVNDIADPLLGARLMLVRSSGKDATANAIDTALAERGRHLYAVHRDDDLVILLPAEEHHADSLLPRAYAASAGLSEPRPLSALPEALRQARVAAGAAAPGAVLEFSAMRGVALLSAAPTREVLLSLAGSTIATLAEHDAETGSSLVVSLRAFLEANGQLESAAASIGVHRHTLRNRLDRAAAFLRCDLDDPRVRAELLLATLALDGEGQR